jgi:hypothetical protein
MKNTIKLFIVVFGLSLTTQLNAQQFGVRGGLNLASMFEQDNDEIFSDGYKDKLGFNVGLTAEFPINKFFFFETGLYSNQRGNRIVIDGENMKIDSKLNLTYLDIPLMAKLKFDVKKVKLFALSGMYFGLGMSGKTKSTITTGGQTEEVSDPVNWGSAVSELNRFDYGIATGFGMEVKSFEVLVSYDFGLANVTNIAANNFKTTNQVVKFSLGYRF